jgi:O-antigen/teichoic acid export membrane protein
MGPSRSGSPSSEPDGVLRSVFSRIRSRRSIGRALTATLLGGIGVQLTLLVTGVVLARALGPENRGYMALLTLVTAVAWQLGGLGIPFALTYAIARAPAAAERIVASVRGAIATQVVLATLAAGLVLGLLTASKPGYVQLGALMTVVAVASGVYQRCGLGVLQGLREFTTFNLWRVAPNASFAIVAAVFLLAGVTDFIPYAAAWAVSRSSFTLATQRAARRAANRTETGAGEPPPKTAILKFGRRSMFGGAPPVETYRLDQSVVALFLAPTALGYYVAALAFTNLPRFIAQSFGLVANPEIARQPTHEAARRSMWRFFWISVPFYLGVVILLWIAAPALARFLFGPEFAQAGGISRILLIATALFCARRVLADAARGAGYPGIGSIAEVFAFVSVLPLFAAFIPTWGVDGVAYALVLSSAIALTILVIGLLRAGSTGNVPPAWLEIHADTIRKDPVAVGDVAA